MQHGVSAVTTRAPSSHEPQGGTLGSQEVHGNGSVGQNTCDHRAGPNWKRSCNQNAVLRNESMLLLLLLLLLLLSLCCLLLPLSRPLGMILSYQQRKLQVSLMFIPCIKQIRMSIICFCTEFGVEFMELKELPPLADFITVHVPLIPQTKGKQME